MAHELRDVLMRATILSGVNKGETTKSCFSSSLLGIGIYVFLKTRTTPNLFTIELTNMDKEKQSATTVEPLKSAQARANVCFAKVMFCKCKVFAENKNHKILCLSSSSSAFGILGKGSSMRTALLAVTEMPGFVEPIFNWP